MNKQRALNLGLVAGLVVICGVIMGALMQQLAKTLLDVISRSESDIKYRSLKVETGPVWILCFVYVVPGALNFFAAFVQNKCVYITSCVFSMISIVLMGLVIIGLIGHAFFSKCEAFLHMTNYTRSNNGTQCECRGIDQEEYKTMPFKQCYFMDDFITLTIALAVIMVVAWIFLVAAFIISCVYACKFKTSAGIVISQAQQPMLQDKEKQQYDN